MRRLVVPVGPVTRARRTRRDHQDQLRAVEKQAHGLGRARADVGDLLRERAAAVEAAGVVPPLRGLLPAHVR